MKQYIISKYNEKRREAKVCVCFNCGKTFLRDKRNIREKNYCSVECLYSNTSKVFVCSYCGKQFKRCRSSECNSKHKKYFCSRKCKDLAQRVGGIKEIQPSHYKDGYSKYRRRALEHYGEKCSVCEYNILEVLEVHHRDSNRKNGKVENLDVLCPTHHVEYQIGLRKYE